MSTIPNVSVPTITMNNLEEIGIPFGNPFGKPVLNERYYYVSPDGLKIYRGTLVYVNKRLRGYTMMDKNEKLEFVDKIYVRKILKKGGRNRKTRRTRKSRRGRKLRNTKKTR
jgi:hypothetical protein